VKRKAACWNFFYHPGSGPFAAGFTVACYYCKEKCVYNCKSSATLTAHCKAKHRNQFESFKNGEPNEIPEPVQQGIQASFAHSMKFGYTEKGAEELLTNFIVEDDQAFQLVECPSFREFVTFICPKYKHKSADTVKRRVMEMFRKSKDELKTILNDNSSKLSYTSDIWTSPTQEAYMAITAHFIDDNWDLQSFIIAFKFIPGSHTGVAMANVFIQVRTFSILTQFRSLQILKLEEKHLLSPSIMLQTTTRSFKV